METINKIDVEKIQAEIKIKRNKIADMIEEKIAAKDEYEKKQHFLHGEIFFNQLEESILHAKLAIAEKRSEVFYMANIDLVIKNGVVSFDSTPHKDYCNEEDYAVKRARNILSVLGCQKQAELKYRIPDKENEIKTTMVTATKEKTLGRKVF